MTFIEISNIAIVLIEDGRNNLLEEDNPNREDLNLVSLPINYIHVVTGTGFNLTSKVLVVIRLFPQSIVSITDRTSLSMNLTAVEVTGLAPPSGYTMDSSLRIKQFVLITRRENTNHTIPFGDSIKFVDEVS
jgi:hypothetical protein